MLKVLTNNHADDLVFYFGMQRSGIHALTNWMEKHHKKEDRLFFNHIPLPLQKGRVTKQKIEKKVVIAGIEDFPPNQFKIDMLSGGCWDYKRRLLVMGLRDPFNLFARPMYMPSTKWIRWIDYAKEFLGQTNFLGDCVKINYNQWCIDIEYRKQISAQLGWEFCDDGIDDVPHLGSSYDGKDYHGRAREMKLQERWKEIQPEEFEIYAKMFPPEIIELSRQIFGQVVPLEFEERIKEANYESARR